MSITVSLPRFEGPLDLLLYLIRKEEMNIMDIKIHEITQQYLEFLEWMKELDLEMAGEFVAMAATLLQIKSQMLLPKYGENGEILDNEDPRKELVQRLLEYQQFQFAAQQLYERSLLGREVWPRGMKEKWDEVLDDEIQLEDNALFSLISAYRSVLKVIKNKVHQVSGKLQSIASRILEIKDLLLPQQTVLFSSLISQIEMRHKQVLITFLSLLELAKLGYVRLAQLTSFQEIFIELRKPIEADAISRVHEYNVPETKELFIDNEQKDLINTKDTPENTVIAASDIDIDIDTNIDIGSDNNTDSVIDIPRYDLTEEEQL